MKLKDLFDVKKIVATNKVLGKPMYLHEFFLTTRFTDTFKITTKVKGENKAIAIRPSTFSADPILREFGSTAVYEDEKMTFKEAHKMTKDDLLKLTYLLKTKDPELLEVFAEQRMDHLAAEDGFLDAVRIRAEVMFVQLITTGKMGVSNEDGATQEVDYMHPVSNKVALLGALQWGVATGTPISDLMKWKKLNKAKTEYAIMSRKTFEDMIKTDEVLNYMKNELKITLPSDEEFTTAIQRKTGLQIVIYEYEAHKRGTEPKKVLFPDNFVSLLPKKLGYMSYGPVTKDIYLGSIGENIESNDYAIIPKTGDGTTNGATITLQQINQNGALKDIHFEIEATMAPDEPEMSNLVTAKTA